MNSRKDTDNPRKDTEADGMDDRTRKPYTAPRLTIYGAIEKLTNTGGKTTRDGWFGRRRH